MRNSVLAVVRDGAIETVEHCERPDWVTTVAEAVPSRFAGLVSQLGIAPIPEREANVEKWARAQVAELVAVDLGRRKFELQGASQRAAAEGDLARARAIQMELAELETERRRLLGR
jgi:DNA primase